MEGHEERDSLYGRIERCLHSAHRRYTVNDLHMMFLRRKSAWKRMGIRREIADIWA
jgi:hypothetical protein